MTWESFCIWLIFSPTCSLWSASSRETETTCTALLRSSAAFRVPVPHRFARSSGRRARLYPSHYHMVKGLLALMSVSPLSHFRRSTCARSHSRRSFAASRRRSSCRSTANWEESSGRSTFPWWKCLRLACLLKQEGGPFFVACDMLRISTITVKVLDHAERTKRNRRMFLCFDPHERWCLNHFLEYFVPDLDNCPSSQG